MLLSFLLALVPSLAPVPDASVPPPSPASVQDDETELEALLAALLQIVEIQTFCSVVPAS